jgi:subfamily B ATP-binding cassette protein MsbA
VFRGHYYTYIRFLRGNWHLLILAALAGLLYAASSALGVPFLLGKVLPAAFGDKIAIETPIATFPSWVGWQPWVLPRGSEVEFAVFFLPTVFIFRGISQWLAGTLINIAGMRVIEAVRSEVFARIQKLPLSFFGRITTGDLMQRLTGDVASVRLVLIDVTNDIMIQPFTLIFAVGMVIVTCLSLDEGWRFLLCLLVVPVSVLLVRFVGTKIQKRNRLANAANVRVTSIAMENLHSPREVRAYNLEDREIARFNQASSAGLHAQGRIARYDKALSPLLEFVAATGIALAIWVGANSGLDLPRLLIIIAALYIAYEPIKKLGRVSNMLRLAEVGLSRLTEIFDAPDEVPDPVEPVRISKIRGELTFQGVSFTYGRETVLHSVATKISAGQSIALVGPSGAGKSTFLNLIPRFFDPSEGVVMLDGHDLRKISLAELRSAIALVSQEPVLFDGSIRDNIRLGRPDADDAAVEHAAKLAGAHDFIHSLPAGFETRVGERGAALSGGQRQRIAIARAFLKDAPILLLDEATSSLDTDTERAIQSSLADLMRGRTTLIVAHRFSTIRDVDRVLVFDKGQIVADGPREKVYANNELFRRLWDQQSGDPV